MAKRTTATAGPANDPTDNPALLTPDAAYLGVHPKTLLKLARSRQLDSVQLAPGGPVRFRRSALNAFLERQTRRARSQEWEA